MIYYVVVNVFVEVIEVTQSLILVTASDWQAKIFSVYLDSLHKLVNINNYSVRSVELWRHCKERMVIYPKSELIDVNLCEEVVKLLKELQKVVQVDYIQVLLAPE